MKALVTGATGFVGSALTRRLREDGHDVRVLIRDRQRLHAGEGDGIEVAEGDVRDREAVRRAMRNREVVFHVAGAFRETGLSADGFWQTNVEGTRSVAEGAAEAGANRLIVCSTGGMHRTPGDGPADETAPVDVSDPYEHSKCEAERVAHETGKARGLDVTALRPTQVYGPGDMRLLKLFRLVRRRFIPWFGPGTARYGLCYIDDLVEAFVRAASASGATGRSYIISGPESPTLNEVRAEIARALGETDGHVLRMPAHPFIWAGMLCETVCPVLRMSPPISRRRMTFFLKDKWYCINRARAELNYEPNVGMREGLEKTVAWYRSQDLL